MGVEQAIDKIIADCQKIQVDDEKSVSLVVEEYKIFLRNYFFKENWFALAEAFVAFCEGRIKEKTFRRRVLRLSKANAEN